MTVAFIFPGQGAQQVGMGRELHDCSAAVRSTFAEADEALGEPISRLIFEGPAEALTLTANTQPAILTVSVAVLRALRERTAKEPCLVAGHSLGEYAALVAAGALSFPDAVRLTRARGTFMQEAVPIGTGAMAAIMGEVSPADVEAVCAAAASGEVVAPANFNAPGQIVISGHEGAVKRASDALAARGAKVIPLKVSAPFHCALMEPAARRLAEVLERTRFEKPTVPVVTNVEAEPNSDAGRIRELLTRQVTAPVRWTDSMRKMIESGVRTFIELGPGNVLTGLLKRLDRNAVSIPVNSPNGLDKALEALEKL